MKKLFLLILSAILFVFAFGCQTPEDMESENEPVYTAEYEFNETHHWKTLVSGEGDSILDYSEHLNYKGKCNKCNYYYDVSNYFEFIKVGHITPGQNTYTWAYKINRFYGEDADAPIHIKIPTTYNGEAVISIGNHLFNPKGDPEGYYNVSEDGVVTSPKNGNDLNVPIESVVIPEGIKFIGSNAFSNTRIKEIVIPDSVVGGYGVKTGNLPTPEKANYNVDNYYWPLSNVCGACLQLEKAVLGDGITHLGGYSFSSCSSLKEIDLGNGLQAIAMRAFYECTALKTVVLPKSLVYMPEGDVVADAVGGKKVAITHYFKYASEIFLEITEEELEARTVPVYQRDYMGNIIPDGINRNPGYCTGWSNMAKLYFVGEWYYDSNGKPQHY